MPRSGGARLSSSSPVWGAEHLRLAADAAGVALWSWDVATDEIALDEKSHQLWGLAVSAGLVTFEALSAHIHPADLDRVRAAFTATREIPGSYDIEFRIMRDCQVKWVSARGKGADQGIVDGIMFGVFLDITERKLAEEARDLLAGEMSHRVKNLFAIASALTVIAARSATTPRDMEIDLGRRLRALGRAHELVRPSLGHQRKAALLGELLAVLLAAYDENGVIGDRIKVASPDLLIGEGSTTTMALVIHELATNSLKYGALSADQGELHIDCTPAETQVVIRWVESGGPAVVRPEGMSGFGSKLVNRSIVDQLGGSIGFDWLPQGVVVTLEVNRARLGT